MSTERRLFPDFPSLMKPRVMHRVAYETYYETEQRTIDICGNGQFNSKPTSKEFSLHKYHLICFRTVESITKDDNLSGS